jgi:DNA-directed RNA polymerase omega subunit
MGCAHGVVGNPDTQKPIFHLTIRADACIIKFYTPGEHMNGLPLEARNMNGLTSQLAAEAIGSRYDMVLIACARARELKKNYTARIISTDGSMVTALMEIEQGEVGADYFQKVHG